MKKYRGNALASLLALAAGCSAALPVFADNDCVDFKWDVSNERALYAQSPVELTAGKDLATAPVIAPNRLYSLRLTSQDRVAFSVSPGKNSSAASTFAGLATLKIAAPGSYRIAVDAPFWIDVVSNGKLVQPTDYQGQRSCSAPHKIVVFDLFDTKPFVLQFSSAQQDHVMVTVTQAPPRKL